MGKDEELLINGHALTGMQDVDILIVRDGKREERIKESNNQSYG